MRFDYAETLRLRRRPSESLLLPSEYQQVEWIGATGTQYIQTNVTLTNGPVRLYAVLQCTSGGAYGRDFFGVRFGSNAGQQGFMLKVTKDRRNFYANSGNASGAISASLSHTEVPFTTDSIVEIDASVSEGNADAGTIHADFTVKGIRGSEETVGITGNNTIKAISILGGVNASTRAAGKIFGAAKAWDDGKLVLCAVPCYRKADGEIGMFDTVNGVFYTNAGTGDFTKGADV